MDAATDAGPTECPSLTPFEPGDATGHPMPLGASATEARAGRLAAAELPTDTLGLATYAAGDFVLANDRIGAIIEDVGDSDIYDPWGGKIVGLAKVRGGRLVEPADFEEAIVGLGRYTVHTESVGVLHDGSDGAAAVVRAVGVFAPLPPIDDFARVLIPQDYSGVRVAIDYSLAPGSEQLEIRMTFEVSHPGTLRIPLVLHAFIQPNRMPSYSPNVGFAIPPGSIPYIGFVRDDGVGYAWSSADGPLNNLFEDTGLNALSSAAIRVDGCMHVERAMARVVVGGPGLDGLLEAVARTDGTTLRAVTGRVLDDTGAAAEHVRVHATLPDGSYVTHAITDATGAFTLHVPAGAIQLTGFRRGDGLAGPVDVGAADTMATLHLPPAGTIHVTIHDAAAGTPLPARVQVTPLDANPTVPESFGEPEPGNARIHVAFPTSGDVALRVPVGRHRVVVSHGFEHELVTRDVTVTAEATTDVDAQLAHVVDTTGILCGDFHIHSLRSLDSADPVRLKITSGVADGVDILARSEHDWAADFQPLIVEMGLEAWAFGVPSDELSTTTYGHFGVVPVTPDASRANGGAPYWAQLHLPDVLATVRASPEAPALIVNHPRSVMKGYFWAVGYDAATGVVARPAQWDDSFTLIEVFNGSSYRQNLSESVADWFSFLDQGRRVFAVGSSDSHRVVTVPVGYPRTCLRFGFDDPRMLTASAVRDALNAGTSVVSGGIYLDARELSTGAEPGAEATGVGDHAMIHVRVQAASWIDVDRLRVIVDGVETEVIPIDATTADPMRPTTRLDIDVSVPVSAAALGSWVVLVAEGDDSLAPAEPGDDPFGVTNPIFLRR